MSIQQKGSGLEQKREEWDKFVNGDHTCFEKIFNTYYKSMYGYGNKLCDQPELVRDCIQDLFRNIWKRRDNLTHIECPNVYLYVSLRRKILKELKSRRRSNGKLDEIDGSFIQFGEEEIIIKNEVRFQQKKKLLNALNQLSDRQKEVVFLYFYNGMSYKEISKILAINRQSVRNHMYRAMETLRSILSPEIMKLVV